MVEAAETDGRRERTARSKEAVIDAILDLLREGDLRPAAVDIAERAGVSVRTVFRLYQDLESLFAAAVERQTEAIAPLLDAPAPSGSLADRVEAVVAHRSRLYEEITPVRRAGVRHAPFQDAVRTGLDRAHRALRVRLRHVFAAELDRAGTAKAELLDAIDLVTSWNAWDTLRADEGLSVRRASGVVTRSLLALLGPYADEET